MREAANDNISIRLIWRIFCNGSFILVYNTSGINYAFKQIFIKTNETI
jgi:hypothetical protein